MAEPLFRVGVPSIGETYGGTWNAGRATGGLGTGVYAFTAREAAENNADPEQRVFAFEDALTDPLYLGGGFRKAVALNDASVEAARLINRVSRGETTFSEARDQLPSRLRRKASTVLINAPGLRETYGLESEAFARAWVDAAEQAADAAATAPRRTATQPINHLLYPDFDGVYPIGEAGERGDYGAVIFKEGIEDCLGRRLSQNEQIAPDELRSCLGR